MPTEPELQDHYLQCRGQSRLNWRVKLLTALWQQLKLIQTDPNLQELILDCLDCALGNRNIQIQGPFQAVLEAQGQITSKK